MASEHPCPNMASEHPCPKLNDFESGAISGDDFESGSMSSDDDEFESAPYSMLLTQEQIRLVRCFWSRLHQEEAPSFNEYQSLSDKQKEAVRAGILIGLFQAFQGVPNLDESWREAIYDFLLEKISPAYSHAMIVKKLGDFCIDNCSSNDESAPIIARCVISCTNKQLFLLATSKSSDREEDRRKRASACLTAFVKSGLSDYTLVMTGDSPTLKRRKLV